MTIAIVRYIGRDPAGIQRVYGEHETADVAETRCREEAFAYVQRRPDTRLLSGWTFIREPVRAAT